MAYEYKVVHDERRQDALLPSWTFLINGEPTLIWCPSEYSVRRKIKRLQDGRSDAFGGPSLVNDKGEVVATAKAPTAKVIPLQEDGTPVVEEVVMKSGRKKQRVKAPKWKYELDGKASEEVFTSEVEAREACAVRAYLTRGKLGRLEEAQEVFKKTMGKTCTVKACPHKHQVFAVSEDGKKYSVRFEDGKISFKELKG